jgi:hypothetical protein
MLHNSIDEKGQAVISHMRDYLLESGLQNCANAFDKALSEVVSWETQGLYRNHYSKTVNRYLCEALLHVNMDNRCTKKQRMLMRGLIESYRGVYGLSTDDFGFEYNI